METVAPQQALPRERFSPLALLRHHEAIRRSLLPGVKRSCRKHRPRSEFDPVLKVPSPRSIHRSRALNSPQWTSICLACGGRVVSAFYRASNVRAETVETPKIAHLSRVRLMTGAIKGAATSPKPTPGSRIRARVSSDHPKSPTAASAATEPRYAAVNNAPSMERATAGSAF